MRRFSVVAVLGVLCYFVVVPVSLGQAVAQAASTSKVAVHGALHKAHRAALAYKQGPTALPHVAPALKAGPAIAMPFRGTLGPVRSKSGTGANAPVVSTTPAIHSSPVVTSGATTPAVLRSFNGLDNVTSAAQNAGDQFTPPDQGMCVGNDPTVPRAPMAVWELVNMAVRETTTNGAVIRPTEGLATFFQTPFAYGDIRCVYDPGTKTFFFTELDSGATIYSNTSVDVGVLNAHGFAVYYFPSTMTGHCLGDQPKVGFDKNALVVSTDQYCTQLTVTANYKGAIVLAMSKRQLVAEATTVNFWTSTPVLQPDASGTTTIPVTGLDPAINTQTTAAYFVNSVPYTTNQHTGINAVGNRLGVWTLYGDRALTNATPTPTTFFLTGTTVTSETYAYPVRAKSTGNGLSHTVTGSPVYSEASLNPDDSRMSGPVEVTKTGAGVELWTTLNAAMTPKGTATVRDGTAWFEINAATHSITKQGNIAAKGAYMIYPAIIAPLSGPVPIVFTLTSPTLNPSAAFTTIGSTTLTVVAAGAGPGMTFAAPGFRWGDYSFAASVGSSNGLWFATEYIPPAADQAKYSNWGTEVFEVAN